MAKIDENADLNSSRFQVVQQLSILAPRQILHCFYLDNYLVVTDQIGNVEFLQDLALVPNIDRILGLKGILRAATSISMAS